MTQARSSRPRGGWREEETAMLFDAVARAEKAGRPLRDAFGDVGERLGRKPNSIRNYYYARVREQPEGRMRKAPFRTFSEEELRFLLREVLMGRSRGESVRACVTRLAAGDRQKMLRYQNKYRSVLKGRPELLEQVAEELRGEGCAVQTPAPPAGESAHAYREALSLSLETGDRTLALMLEGLGELLRRVVRAENAAREASGSAAVRAAADMEHKWQEARRDADRLRVQVDLLKMQVEDAMKQGFEVGGEG